MNHNFYNINKEEHLSCVEKFGSPLYVYDTEIIAKQINRLKKAFGKLPVQIHYACKALSNLSILAFIKSEGLGLDTVSIQEVQLGLKAGFEPNEIMFTPNSVGMSEIEEAMNLGVVLNIDNISILEQFGNQFGDSYPISIRLNPHIMAGGNHNISTGHIDSKFGISIYQMRHVERIAERTKVKIEGLHMHTGSDILDADVFLKGADILLEFALNFPNLRFVDFGSGFKVPYGPDDLETNVDELGLKLEQRMNKFYQDYGRQVEVWFEPGKFIVSEAGKFLVKVNVVKQTTATVFVGVNSGFNHLIRPMFYGAKHQIQNISNPNGVERIYTVVGMVCETDTFAWDIRLNEVREGDILAFYNAGAYGFEMSMNYNSRFRPAEALLHNKEAKLIRKADVLEDITRNQIVLRF